MEPKNIIICFDGTCNHPRDAKQEREWFGSGEIEDNGITNILKLHAMFGGSLTNEAKTVDQHSFYYSGVGTYGSKIQQIFNSAFAPPNLDVGRVIKIAGRDLRQTYHPGDRVFLFGFSRGAAIARRFASVIEDYLPSAQVDEPIVRFLGVFDTVASIGFPNLDSDDKPVSDVVFENGTVSPNVAEALHLLSLDDKRIAFHPTLMNKDSRVTEIWFPGAHSDVGGGFWYDGLSDITLEFMVEELKSRQLGLDIKNPKEIEYRNLVANNDAYRVDLDDVFIKPNHTGRIHTKDRWAPIALATLNPRTVRVNIDDHPSENERPLIHYKVIERINDVVEYRPRALKGVKHTVLNADGSKSEHSGIVDHIL
ncbi:DUF2235 domain-containing protein [Thiomicrorhabdus sp.]|uniref:DUF2235 domain-containing protein n=1 Tax=Thiomicrorhabdus sp. TaxID=2039724 RepID=UPI0029C8CCC2|nr:DUF2235 domain-containing protein [Thiomicrorhabdus sp.]